MDARGPLSVGFWEVAGSGGGVARSDDGGRTFTLLEGIAGRPVRGLAVAAPRTPTGRGRRHAGGRASARRTPVSSWQRISPEGHPDLRNVELGRDRPARARRLYAGTWHLPWKTLDAGRTWAAGARGHDRRLDVITLTIDRAYARTVYATACSGVYRSTGAGGPGRIRGIPAAAAARAPSPRTPTTGPFYAGTTEGLWRAGTAGLWSLETPASWS